MKCYLQLNKTFSGARFGFTDTFKKKKKKGAGEGGEPTGSERALHQLRLGSLPAVEQPALPLGPQHQRRRPAVRRRVGRAGPEEGHVHTHPPEDETTGEFGGNRCAGGAAAAAAEELNVNSRTVMTRG